MEKEMKSVVEVINFLHEVDLLEAHLDEHQHFIDKIVVVESGRTYSGMAKRLFFEEHKERFRKYNVVHEILPFKLHTPIPSVYGEKDQKKWFDVRRNNREAQQRYVFEKYKGEADYICNSDADEIWSKEHWAESIMTCMDDDYMWIAPKLKYFNCYVDAVCSGTQGHWRISKSTAPSHVRQKHTHRGYSNGFAGWHFSNCYKTPLDIWYKGIGIAQSCGYLGWETVPSPLECEELIKKGIDPVTKESLNRGVVMPNEDISWLPEFMQKNIHLYPWVPDKVRDRANISEWRP